MSETCPECEREQPDGFERHYRTCPLNNLARHIDGTVQ